MNNETKYSKAGIKREGEVKKQLKMAGIFSIIRVCF